MHRQEQVIEGFRLSPQQKRLWQLQNDSQAYHAQCAILIDGDLKSEALEGALRKIMQRHEILRTTLDWFPGLDTPLQLVLETPPLPFRKVDLSDKQPQEFEQSVSDLLQEDSRPYELQRGLLVRFCLGRLSASRHVLLVSLHSLCADSWTLKNLFKEISRFYAAEIKGQETSDEPVQYLQFSEWQNELVEEESEETDDQRQELSRLVSDLALPLESNPAGISKSSSHIFSPESMTLILDSSHTARIEAISHNHGSSFSGFLLACWQILLWRLSGEEEIIIECLFDGRQFEDLHDVLGLFARYVPVRGTFRDGLWFEEVMEWAMSSLQQAHNSQEFFLHAMASGKVAGRAKAIGFEYEEWPRAEHAGLLTLSYWKQYCCIDRFKLKLVGYRKAEGMTIEFQYDPVTFSEESIKLIQERYLTLIESMVSGEQALIGGLEIVGRREREKLLLGWNETEERDPDRRYIHDRIAAQAHETPESIAVIYKEERLSFGELDQRADRLANYLRSFGVGPDCVVGLYLERSTDMMLGLLGILKAGGAYLPLELEQSVERLRVILEESGVRVVVTNQEIAGGLPGSRFEVVVLDRDWEQVIASSRMAPEMELSPENLAYVIYTSGSTGKPKGVMVRHSSVANLLEGLKGVIYEVEGDKLTVSLNAPLTFDASVKQVIQLANGHRLCVVPEEDRVDGGSLLEYLGSNRVDVLDCTPSQLRVLIDAGLGKRERAPRIVLVGGEAIDRQSWEEMSLSERVKYYNVYGPTECTVDSTVSEVNEGREANIGSPISNIRTYILDENGRVTPTGVVGEIYIGGAGVARGYMCEAGMTAEKFVPDPFGNREGGRLYRTGDLGRYLVDGKIVYEGRKDGQVKVRGYRIELGEIEEVLRRHPGVREAIVTLREDRPGQKRLVGYVVGKHEGRFEQAEAPEREKANVDEPWERITEEELKKYVKSRVPDYMAPAAILVIGELPLTRNGKVDRGALPKPEEVKIEVEESQDRSTYEELIGGIWEEALKVGRVRREDNFFEIGGHSLLATQVISRIRDLFGVEIGVRSLFEKPTIEGLAQRVEGAMRAGEKNELPLLVRASRERKLPLSFAQQRLWFLDQLEPNSPFYNCFVAVRLERGLELDILERVINEIVRRHEVLRTRIEDDAGEPVQMIDEWEPQRLEIEDLTGLTREEREEQTRRIAKEEAGRGFDLSRGPLIRVKVLKTEEEPHVLLFTMHHIVSDGWSMGILVREVEALYQAYSAGEPSPLEELEIQYADFALWQRQWLEGEVLEEELEYWRKQLAGIEDLELPTDHLRPAIQSYRGARRGFVVERDLTQRLRALGRQEGVTLFMTLLGAFDVLMNRYTGQEDIVLGTDIANRNRVEIEGLIGFFVNQLILRVEVKSRESFRELLKRVREVCLGAYAHQDVPFEKLVEELQPERDLSRSPLFQAKLILQNAPKVWPELKGTKLSKVGDGEVETARIDLTVALVDAGHSLTGAVEYSRDLFEERTIERLINHYMNVLSQIVEESGRLISQFCLLSEQEREQIVVGWNETAKPYAQDRCIHELFAEQADRNPDRIALIHKRDQVSYRELDRRANQLAHYLQGLGVEPEVVVGLCLERSVQMVVALLGALKAGGAYLPLDPESPLERLAFVLEDAGAGVLLTEQKLEKRLPAYWGQAICLDSEWERISRERECEPESEVIGENLAYVIYTSGSTGRPKGVMINQKGVVNYLDWAREAYRIEEGEGAPVNSSIGFDLTVTSLYGPLVSGKSVNLLSEKEGVEALATNLSHESGYSLVKLTPSHLEVLAEQMGDSEVEGKARVLVIGGETLRTVSLKYWQERSRVTRLINEYGPTETVVGCCVYEVNGSGNERETVPIGRPIANTQMYVLDRELEPSPIGVKGEIYISGIGLARGYVRKPESTGEKFIPNRFGRAGERLYRTGDLGRYLSDGTLEFLGRRDDQVKVRGYRIELGEIEAVLGEHRSVRQSVVVARENERGDKRLVGYVVGDDVATSGELKRHVRERLPEYMVPEAILVLKEMPITANGKIDRKSLPTEQSAGSQPGGEYVPPRTPVEEILVGIFEEVLKQDRVGITDNFFEVGGHSLLATQVASRVRNTFGVEIGVRSIFEEEAVRGLAQRIEAAMIKGEKEVAPPLVKASREEQRGGRLPLSFAQQRLWFIEQLEPGNTLYNIPGVVRLEGKLDLETLDRVINEIVRRHEVLRTRFDVQAGMPVQVIEDWKPRRLEVEDLTNVPRGEREEKARRIAREEAGTGFDLSRGPLLRVKVLKLEEDEHVALFTMHHIVSDGWSTGILIKELGTLYRAYSRGESSPLAELPIQYADFAVWQRAWLQGEVLEKKLGYWRKQLQGMEPLGLPADHSRPAAPGHLGARHRFVIESEVIEKLRELGGRAGATLFMTLLGSFDVLMSRYSGQEEVALGTDIANRNRAEIEGLIGFFVNQLVLRVETKTSESFRDLLLRVRDVCLGAYTHQDVPFEKLVEELQPERDPSRSPLFQAKLNLHNASREELKLEGMGLSSIGSEVGTASEAQAARLDLTVSITDMGTEERRDLVGIVGYSRDLFEAETIERLMNHYTNVLKSVAEDDARPISELSLLSDQEREQILVEWNETEREYKEIRPVHEQIAEQARLRPESIAVIYKEEQISYWGLESRSNQLATYLRSLGVGPECVVGLYLERSLDMMIGLLGILKAGGAYLPLEVRQPVERIEMMLENVGAKVVVTKQYLTGSLPASGPQVVMLDGGWEQIAGCSRMAPEVQLTPENLAYVIYTSGSTGKPKGVMVRHHSVMNLMEGLKEAIYEGEGADLTISLNASIAFDASVKQIIQLGNGHRLCIVPEEDRVDGEALLEYLSGHGVDVLDCTPSQLIMLAEAGLGVKDKDPKVVLVGGEAIDERSWEEISASKCVTYYNMYGPTECTVDAMVCKVNESEKPTIGRPIANTRRYVLDRELNLVPLGAQGELYISGIGVARGYWGWPELTAEKFIPNRFSGERGERLYQTGDLGRYLPDGSIEFLGRTDAQVKIRGYRIELGEIEAVLNEHRSVKQSIVVVSADDLGGKRLLGYVVGERGVTGADLKKYLRERLPEYMVPEAVQVLEAMPITANGKIDRKRLSMIEDGNRSLEQTYVDAQTPVEEILVGIFEDVLTVDRVGTHDNFFEIGGHSLLATQVVSRVRNTFGVDIGVRSIFKDATVEGLARSIQEAMRAGERDEAPPLVRTSREGRLPLSFAQQRLWFLDQLMPNNPFYNCPGAVRLEGRLDLEALESVINEIVRRHEALRTRFEVVEGEPIQVIEEWKPRRLLVEDLTSLIPEMREEAVRRIRREEARTGFDLSRGPLIRVKALELGEEQHVVLFTMHHIVSDGWSMEVLVREVCEIYEAMSEGSKSPLPELEIQYADYAVWQRKYLSGEILKGEVEYWKGQLQGAAVMELPTDYARPVTPSYQGGRERIGIRKELSEGLRRLSQLEGATVFMVLIAAFKVVLMRYSGMEDVSIGTAIANRTRRGVERLIGFFINTLVMRTDLGGNPSFKELIKREREVALGAYAHQEVPFEKVVEEINPDRDLSRNPLFQVMMVLQNARRTELEIRGLTVMGIEDEVGAAKFDLMLILTEGIEGITGSLEYSQDLYEGETIRRMARHYERVVEEVVRDAEQRIREIELMTESERDEILVRWNETAAEYPRDRPIQELFEEQVELRPESVAAVYEEKELSYRELNRRANQLAHHLRRFGVGPEVRIGICVRRSLEMIVGLLGILKAGGAYIPLDPGYPAERLRFMLEDAAPLMLLTEERWLGELSEFEGETLCLDRDWPLIEGLSVENPPNWVSGENLAYVIYTSGSTGQPKGVMGLHGAAINRFAWMWKTYPFTTEEVACQKTSLSFVDSVWEIFGPLLRGIRIVIIEDALVKDVNRLASMLEAEQVSRIVLVPSLLRSLLGSINDLSGGLRSMKYCISSGEALSRELSEGFLQRLSESRLLNLYGSSEVSADASWQEVRSSVPRSGVPIGQPIANTQIYLLDTQLNSVPAGVPAELYIGGDGLARGYLNRPDLTVDKFIPNPYGGERGGRLYKTGDLGRYLPDGNIEFLGRIDHQVKIRGYRIELGEIEAQLSAHPGVCQCVVIAHQDKMEEKRLVAYVVRERESPPSLNELRNYLKERLPEYMLPVGFVWLDQMPLTPNGKLNRMALFESCATLIAREKEYVAPRGPVEKVLVGIWSEVLRVEKVGVEDDFFELGGHSLLLTQVASRVRSAFSLSLPLRVLFENPTIKQLNVAIAAEHLVEADSTEAFELMEELQRLSAEEIQTVLESDLNEAFNG